MQKSLTYFIYARKSTEGADRQVLSIEGQLQELHRIVQRDGLVVIDTYTESKSAHIPENRPLFAEMIKRLVKGEANGIIIWHINRISRNPKESGEIQQLLQDGVISSIITPYRHFRSEDNALLFSIETSEANQYSRDLSVNVKRGLKQKCERGQPPGSALLGYLNTKSSIRGTNEIVIDPERFPVVRKGFELILSGTYTVREALEKINNEYGLRTRPGKFHGGKPLSRSGFYRMLINPFYYGYFYRNNILYKGSYPSMISIEEYDKIQEILGRKGRPRYSKHEFAYTGLFNCAECGSSVTASLKTKQIKETGLPKSYEFYHCTHRKSGAKHCSQRSYIPVAIIEEQIIKELKKCDILPYFKTWALATIEKNYQKELEKSESLLKTEEQYEQGLRQELSNLVDLRISNTISEDLFLQKKAEKEAQLLRVQEKRNRISHSSLSWFSEIKEQLCFAADIETRYKKSGIKEKKQICYDIGRNWNIKDKKVFIHKHKWILSLQNFKGKSDKVLKRLEPDFNLKNKGDNTLFKRMRPILRGLINDVRTSIQENSDLPL